MCQGLALCSLFLQIVESIWCQTVGIQKQSTHTSIYSVCTVHTHYKLACSLWCHPNRYVNHFSGEEETQFKNSRCILGMFFGILSQLCTNTDLFFSVSFSLHENMYCFVIFFPIFMVYWGIFKMLGCKDLRTLTLNYIRIKIWSFSWGIWGQLCTVCQYTSLQTHMRRSYHVIDFPEYNQKYIWPFVWAQSGGNSESSQWSVSVIWSCHQANP